MKGEKMEHEIEFGTLHPDGKTTDVRMIKQSDVGRCPFYILVADHYREDGSCKCNDLKYRKSVMSKWGYTKKDFIAAGMKGE